MSKPRAYPYNLIDVAAKWYRNKALDTLRSDICELLVASESQGSWVKGASRKVTAALSKQDNARRFARADIELEGLRLPGSTSLLSEGWNLKHAMDYGQVQKAPALLPIVIKLEVVCKTANERSALATARAWCEDFAPIAELVELLNATRPPPVFIFDTLSPTVLANVGETMGIKLTSIRLPPIKWTWRTITITGAHGPMQVRIAVPEITWPEGTKHNCSRFCHGSKAGNGQCHACGHAIKNPFNWVPLLADTDTGPVSLWVGRDCAWNLFHVKVTGDAEYTRTE